LLKNRTRIATINTAVQQRIAPLVATEKKVLGFNYNYLFAAAASIALLIGGVFFFQQFTSSSMHESDVAVLNTENTPIDEAPSKETVAIPKEEEEKNSAGTGDQPVQAERSKEANPYRTSDEAAQPIYKQVGPPAIVTATNELVVTEQNGESYSTTVTLNDAAAKPMPETSITPPGANLDLEQENRTDGLKKAEDQEVVNAKTIASGSAETRWSAPSADKDTKNSNQTNSNQEEVAKESFKKKDRLAKKAKAKEEVVASETPANAGYVAPTMSQDNNDIAKVIDATSVNADTTESFFTSAEIMPEYVGGYLELLKFIQKNIHAPAILDKTNPPASTKVYVQFIVGKEGIIRSVKITKGINVAIDNEVLRVIKMMPNWKPGMRGGKTVAVQMNLPIQLELK
jgi:Gram-negative bacterial TonB protein C-terminal